MAMTRSSGVLPRVQDRCLGFALWCMNQEERGRVFPWLLLLPAFIAGSIGAVLYIVTDTNASSDLG